MEKEMKDEDKPTGILKRWIVKRGEYDELRKALRETQKEKRECEKRLAELESQKDVLENAEQVQKRIQELVKEVKALREAKVNGFSPTAVVHVQTNHEDRFLEYAHRLGAQAPTLIITDQETSITEISEETIKDLYRLITGDDE